MYNSYQEVERGGKMKTVKISLDLPEALIKKINSEAKDKVRSRSGQIIYILNEYYKGK